MHISLTPEKWPSCSYIDPLSESNRAFAIGKKSVVYHFY